MSLPTGADHVCFDTTAPLRFAQVGVLDILREWFPKPFAPCAVYQLELADHVSKSAEAREIVGTPWLQEVTVDDAADLAYITYLHEQRWKSDPGKNRGEAEVVVVCRRYGWTAVMEDEEGRTAAEENGTPCAYMLTIVVAAAAQGLLSAKEAWDLHCQIEDGRRRALLMPDSVHRPAFEACVQSFRRIWQKNGQPDWPRLLSVPKLKDVILLERKRN